MFDWRVLRPMLMLGLLMLGAAIGIGYFAYRGINKDFTQKEAREEQGQNPEVTDVGESPIVDGRAPYPFVNPVVTLQPPFANVITNPVCPPYCQETVISEDGIFLAPGLRALAPPLCNGCFDSPARLAPGPYAYLPNTNTAPTVR